MNKKILIVLIGLLASASLMAQSKSDPLAKRFKDLTGDWQGETKPRSATGEFSLYADPARHILVRKNTAVYPGPDDRLVTRLDSMAIFSTDSNKTFEANYSNDEGHQIHYSISFEGKSTVIFTSDASTAAIRYRLTYSFPDKEKSTVIVKSETAPPGQPEGFAIDKESAYHRKKP